MYNRRRVAAAVNERFIFARRRYKRDTYTTYTCMTSTTRTTISGVSLWISHRLPQSVHTAKMSLWYWAPFPARNKGFRGAPQVSERRGSRTVPRPNTRRNDGNRKDVNHARSLFEKRQVSPLNGLLRESNRSEQPEYLSLRYAFEREEDFHRRS